MDLVIGKRMSLSKKTYKDEGEVAEAIAKMLLRATKSVDYSTGLSATFHARPDVANAFLTATERTRSFRVLLDSYVDVANFKANPELRWLLDLWQNKKVEIRKSEQRIPHRVIVDERDFRLETSHPPGETGDKNLILLNADDTVSNYTKPKIAEFENTWVASKPIE